MGGALRTIRARDQPVQADVDHAFTRAWKTVDEPPGRGYEIDMDFTGSSGHGSSVASVRWERT
jgi:hypothetical protein